MMSSIFKPRQRLLVDSSCSKALSNPLILANIFRFLDFKSLKSVRLVSQIWGVEALKRFSDFDVVINLQPPFKRTTASILESLLKRDHLRPCLNLSFQTPGWAYSLYNDKHESHFVLRLLSSLVLQHRISSSHRPRNHEKTDIKALNILQGMGSWVTELRLELTLMTERDAQLVVNILATMPNLSKLCFDILDIREEGLLGFPSPSDLDDRCFLPPSLIVLGLKVHPDGYKVDGHDGVTLDGVIHFMIAISSSNIQFLDLVGRQFKIGGSSQDQIVVETWMLVIFNILDVDPETFPRLSGFKEEWRSGPDSDSSLPYPHHNFYQSFPRSLSHFHFDCSVSDVDVNNKEEWLCQIDKLRQIIRRHALTLQTFYMDIRWYSRMDFYPSISDNIPVQQEVEMLPHLPILTSLCLTINTINVEGRDLEMINDATFNLRHIFLNGSQALEQIFPSLTTLSLILSSIEPKSVPEIWEHIVPNMGLMGEELVFHQIKHLNVWIIVEEDENFGDGHDGCMSSPQLSRLLAIFPSLETLRHLKKKRRNNDNRLFFVCKHVRHSSRKKKNGESQITSPAWTTFTKTWNGCPEVRGEKELSWYFARERLQHLLTSCESNWWF